MKWTRELRIARRSLRTAMRAASSMAKAHARLSPVVRPQFNGGVAPATDLGDFGSNPGGLSMLVHAPAGGTKPGAALIVLLHGCGQSARTFSRDGGWIALADRFGIPLVLPEQSDDNNRGRCFNWFRPLHTTRGLGEAESIRQMVSAAVDRFQSNPRRVFIAGLSAGGAMTAAMLAAYPEVFAGGAAIAGLPVGAATSTAEALRRMAEAGPVRAPSAWADQVRHAAPAGYAGPWPRLAIWHGEADRVVDPANARLLAMQWSALHRLNAASTEATELLGARRERWDSAGQPVVELWMLPGVAHEWPAGATDAIADFWGLAAD